MIRGGRRYYGLRYDPKVSNVRRMVILANGPSLSDDIERLQKEGANNDIDFLMMNYSASQGMFSEVKPRYYALADPMFFVEDARIGRVQKMFKDLNDKVSWKMTLFLAYDVQDFLRFSGLDNPNIECQRIYPNLTPSLGPRKFKDYMSGIAMPYLGTVANMAVYAGIQLGYKRIELCGVDMSFFEGLCINDKNETCTIERHFYDDKITLRPYIDQRTGRAMKLDKYIIMVLRMIETHNELCKYGSSLGVEFVNRTRCSMLDCYPRLINIKPELYK